MWHESITALGLVKIGVDECKKAYGLYCDFQEVKSIVDEFEGADFSKKKYSNFLNNIIKKISSLETKLEIRTLERDQALEKEKSRTLERDQAIEQERMRTIERDRANDRATIRTFERDQAIESKARLKLKFLTFGGIACIVFFIFGYLSQFIKGF